METDAKKLKELIESSDPILITSHISPDPDAVSSVLLMGLTLKKSFPNKQVEIVLEEEPFRLDFLNDYNDIKFQKLLKAISDVNPELLIMLDGNNYDRCSRHDGNEIKHSIVENGVSTIIIDHHEPNDAADSDLFIRQDSPATSQIVHQLLFDDLKFEKPKDAAQTAMVGFYADTGGFVHLKAGKQGKVFDFAEELVAKGANIERIKNQLSQYDEADMTVLSSLCSNISHHRDFSYSFLDDKFISDWHDSGKPAAQLQIGTGLFLDEFIRNIGGRQWGFIIYRNELQGKGMYSVSFRAVAGTKDVAGIANKLGGGGHKPAAGAKFDARSIEEALHKVKKAILEP